MENFEKAKELSLKAIQLSSCCKTVWFYGNVIHEAHTILGRIALLSDDLKTSKQHLLESGKTPGSPQLNSFGPNMSLAKLLLERNERQVVLEYIELCKIFWDPKFQYDVDEWINLIKQKKTPDFGAHLVR